MDFNDLITQEHNRALRNIFKGFIKGSFLIDIKSKVMEKLGAEIFKLYDFSLSNEKVVSNIMDNACEYDICRFVVGLHRSNTVFLTSEERVVKEKENVYKSQLVNDVIENLRLRYYGSAFFRQQPIMKGDSFIYYHLPYDLFVMCMKCNEMLRACANEQNRYYNLYCSITNKSIAALSLLEDNFLDNAYPICRAITELYIKLLILKIRPNALKLHNEFVNYEINKSCCTQKYSDDFNDKYASRTCNRHVNKIDYLHFGWVDSIEDFHNSVRTKPYSINGIISYLIKYYGSEYKNLFDNICYFYRMCHVYAHGNAMISKYPLLHYFEISLMLYYAIASTYKMMCEDFKFEKSLEGIDILQKAEKDFNMVVSQYVSRNTEKFEDYYKKK